MKKLMSQTGIITKGFLRSPEKLAKFIFFIVLMGLSVAAFCQSTGSISGRAIGSLTKTGVEFATVSIFKQGATVPFNGASADQKGNFKIVNVNKSLVRNFFKSA